VYSAGHASTGGATPKLSESEFRELKNEQNSENFQILQILIQTMIRLAWRLTVALIRFFALAQNDKKGA